LEVDATDLGHRVECPACRAVFTAETSPPPPPTPAPDSRVVVCTECRADVTVAAEDLGHLLQCPRCNGTFVAAGPPPGRADRQEADDDRGPGWQRRSERQSRYDDDDDRPRRRSRYDDDDDYDRPRRRRRRPSRYDDDYEDNSPEGLIAHAKRECGAAGIGLIVIAVLGLLGGVLGVVLYGAVLGGAFGGGGGGGFGNMSPEEVWVNMGMSVLQLFVSGFLLYAGIQLREVKQYGMCMIALVMAMVPGFSPCCLLGLVFGIIGITKLNDPRVKRGFEANRAGYLNDGYN
jgi:uncharacterized C2H2 Zn-finger protein